MYCKKCNLTFDDSFKYCNQCGSPLMSKLDAIGIELVENQEGAFEKFYAETNSDISDYLYHRVEAEHLESAVEEFYTKLLIAVRSYDEDDTNFTEWFHQFIRQFTLKYAGLHPLFDGDAEQFTELAPNLTLPEIRIETDISMRSEKRRSLLDQIMAGVSEQERICLSLRYIEQMSLREIAREMHTSENVITHYFYTGNEKIYQNFNQNEIAEHNNLFGMNSLSFIIWLLKYDDFATTAPINPQKILNAIKVKNPEKTVAEYKSIYEEKENQIETAKKRKKVARQISYQNRGIDEEPVKQKPVEEEQGRYEGYEAPDSSGGTGNIIIKILIAICIIIIITVAALIAMNIVSRKGNDTDDTQTTTAAEVTTTEQNSAAATTEESIGFGDAVKLYEQYLLDNSMNGKFYAVIQAGENQDPIMITADNDGQSSEDTFVPSSEDTGYEITGTYVIINGAVEQLTNTLQQKEEDKAWRLYDEHLTSYYTEDGVQKVRTMEITGDSYKFSTVSVPGDYEEYAEIIDLEEFKGEVTTEATTEEDLGQAVDYEVIVQSNDGTLNVRDTYSTSGSIINVLRNGDRVHIIREKDGWGQLESNGWIALRYTVDPSQATTTEATTEVTTEQTTETTQETTQASDSTTETTQTTENVGTPTSKTVTIASPQGGGLNVHTEPNASSPTTRVLKNGEQVNIVAQKGEWGQLSDGTWIYLGYTN